jgi:hypothetical protein
MANKNINLSPSYHDHVADNVLLNGLIIADGEHVHAADNIDLPVHCLGGLDGYLVHAADACDVSLSWHATTLLDDGKTQPVLPTLRLLAKSGERIELDAELPGVRLAEMRAGARTDADLNLPDLELNATVKVGATARLSRRLPALEGLGRFGARGADDLVLPFLELNIAMVGDRLGRLAKSLPGLNLTAVGSTPVAGVLDKRLPAVRLEAETLADGHGQLDVNLPAIKAIADALVGAGGALSAVLPDLALDITSGLYGDALSLDAVLPALVMGPVGTGSQDVGPGKLVDESRFDGIVLRHER